MATATYKCPNCGGGLKFDPDVQKSTCEYCLSEFTNQELAEISAAIEQKAAAARQAETQAQTQAETQAETPAQTMKSADDDQPLTHMVGYVCDSCGAEVVTEDTTSATFCYYCHNPVLVTGRLTGVYKPDKIIPFQYDREKAIEKFLAWAKTRKFVPVLLQLIPARKNHGSILAVLDGRLPGQRGLCRHRNEPARLGLRQYGAY